ncbi:MAG: hypothetical protein JST80_06140 [Bdellovibrionales bacterium]|nr:hypothetical protein [Bdellovibrionales bacterium]
MKNVSGYSVILVLLALGPQAWAQVFDQVCPNDPLHETAQDCPWAGVSRSLKDVTDFDVIRNTMNDKLPGFLPELESDAKSRQLLNLWGLSRNMDESNLTVKTIPPNLLAFFNSILKVDYDDKFEIGHAGLNHTYGYLFSTVYTPYGYKRARYTAGEIEAGFDLPESTFGGLPPVGTLLGNMTYFAGTIAFRDPNAKLSRIELEEILDQKQIGLSDQLAKYDFKKLKVRRLIEKVDTDKIYLEIRTDIVEMPLTHTKGSDTALLIYSIDFHAPGQENRPRIITAFPVNQAFGDGLFTQEGIDSDKPVVLKLKYNAMLPVTIPAEQMVGKRSIFNEQSSN